MGSRIRCLPRSGPPACVVAGLLLALWGCQAAPGSEPNPLVAAEAAIPVDQELVERRLLRGGGDTCNDDRDCGPSAARGTCLLGTCFGLLTTDSAAARAVLVDRIAALPRALADDVERVCATLLWRAEAMPAQRIAAAQGLYAVASARPLDACGRACDELRKLLDEPDEGLASTARLGLAQLGDVSVIPALARDLRSGTEHSRCASARAMGAAWQRSGRAGGEISVALLAALQDSSPMVRRVAAEALASHVEDAEVAAGLQAARRLHPADLGYVVDRANTSGGQARGVGEP